jgi:hypothetical protein
MKTTTATEPELDETPVDAPPPGELHIVLRGSHPVALCGYVTKMPWNAQVETAGRDRCAKCFAIARDRFGGYRG